MNSGRAVDINQILREMVEMDGSDLHLIPGVPPMVRQYGELVALDSYDHLVPEDISILLYPILEPHHRRQLEETWELDFSYSVDGLSRFRGNAMKQRNSLAVVLRAIPWKVPLLSDLGLPAAVDDFAELPHGLVLLTGSTGSGKTTTLAGLVGKINRERSVNIITIEDPIEFIHTHDRSVIRQREVGTDTRSFVDALRHALRHDPDVILISEMKDRDSIAIALTAAETGHLVLSTLHTKTAPLAIQRIIDIFPDALQSQIRQQVADSLQGVVAQQIVPRSDRRGRVVAAEVLVASTGVRNLIREGKEHQLCTAMETGRSMGMQTMDHALAQLCLKGTISRDIAFEHCVDRRELERALAL